MAIYDSGTASLAANGTVTGVGTTWMAPLTLIRVGATIVFKTEPVKIYTISEIISDTQIDVYNPNYEVVPAGTGYAILAHDGITVQGLAQDVAETLRYYQSRESEVAIAVDAFKDFDQQKFSNDVTQVNTKYEQIFTIGAQVSTDKDAAAASAQSASLDKDAAALSAQQAADYAASLNTANLLRKDLNFSDVADKEEARTNLDIGLSATFDTVPVDNGGTGATTSAQACLNLRAVNFDYPSTTNYASPNIPTSIGFYRNDGVPSPYPGGDGGPFVYAEIMTIAEQGGVSGNWSQIGFSTASTRAPRYRQRFADPAIITNWRDFLVRDLNTTVDSNGFIKIASPIVKIKGDGTAEFNDESEGCTVTRLSKGVYVVSGCLGLNSDASWGGTDGGFEIPTDINKQPLIWLDYKVLADGSVEIRTYHRTHTDAPEFARNIIDGISDGDPVDIPTNTYVSVRVEMP